jgi:hypothetical protein
VVSHTHTHTDSDVGAEDDDYAALAEPPEEMKKRYAKFLESLLAMQAEEEEQERNKDSGRGGPNNDASADPDDDNDNSGEVRISPARVQDLACLTCVLTCAAGLAQEAETA